MQRREFLGKLLLGAGAVTATLVLPRDVHAAPLRQAGMPRRTSAPTPVEATSAKLTLPGPPAVELPAGTFAGATVEWVGPIVDGVIPVILRGADGVRFQIDLAARGHGPRPVATTKTLALFLANEGHGATSTPESQGLALLALARALRDEERRGWRAPVLDGLTARSPTKVHYFV